VEYRRAKTGAERWGRTTASSRCFLPSLIAVDIAAAGTCLFAIVVPILLELD
jgi:hypothetical protein